MDPTTRQRLVYELQELLTKGNAHVPFEDACTDVPAELLNKQVPGLPYTIWQVAEHVRIAQWDIVEFCLHAHHESPKWPEGYWPAPHESASSARWQATLAHIRQDRTRFLALLNDETQDLLAPLAHGTGQTLLREAHLIADHAAYHTGQIILLRRLLHDWE
ncbi:DinB family protein [Hymenobacter sediminicola]|uniref:DinB family protein n=1 Tax=Hymenobacter sediminicola TaxID=2761579 RepID=A0A7G7WBC5_9BACT|nr:DinB family protein [Hymenobacter sediminicola]QNH63668.1 DinB family protein [Hymenobacter sediminicola]